MSHGSSLTTPGYGGWVQCSPAIPLRPWRRPRLQHAPRRKAQRRSTVQGESAAEGEGATRSTSGTAHRAPRQKSTATWPFISVGLTGVQIGGEPTGTSALHRSTWRRRLCCGARWRRRKQLRRRCASWRRCRRRSSICGSSRRTTLGARRRSRCTSTRRSTPFARPPRARCRRCHRYQRHAASTVQAPRWRAEAVSPARRQPATQLARLLDTLRAMMRPA